MNFSGVDTVGRLWLVAEVPDIPPSNPPKPYLLEVFDPRTASVLSSQRIPAVVRLFPNGNPAFSGAVDADGIVSVAIWSFRFLER